MVFLPAHDLGHGSLISDGFIEVFCSQSPPLARSGSKSDRQTVASRKETSCHSVTPFRWSCWNPVSTRISSIYIYIYTIILSIYLSIYIYIYITTKLGREIHQVTRSWGFVPWLRCNLWGFAPEMSWSIWRMGWPASWEPRPLQFAGTLRGEIDQCKATLSGLLLRGCCGWEDGGTLAKEWSWHLYDVGEMTLTRRKRHYMAGGLGSKLLFKPAKILAILGWVIAIQFCHVSSNHKQVLRFITLVFFLRLPGSCRHPPRYLDPSWRWRSTYLDPSSRVTWGMTTTQAC